MGPNWVLVARPLVCLIEAGEHCDDGFLSLTFL